MVLFQDNIVLEQFAIIRAYSLSTTPPDKMQPPPCIDIKQARKGDRQNHHPTQNLPNGWRNLPAPFIQNMPELYYFIASQMIIIIINNIYIFIFLLWHKHSGSSITLYRTFIIIIIILIIINITRIIILIILL